MGRRSRRDHCFVAVKLLSPKGGALQKPLLKKTVIKPFTTCVLFFFTVPEISTTSPALPAWS